MAGIDGSGHVCGGLIGGFGEKLTDATAGRAFLICHFVPDGFALYLLLTAVSLVPPQARANGLDAGKSTCCKPSVEAVGGTVVARGNTNGHTESCGVLEERIELGEGLLAP